MHRTCFPEGHRFESSSPESIIFFLCCLFVLRSEILLLLYIPAPRSSYAKLKVFLIVLSTVDLLIKKKDAFFKLRYIHSSLNLPVYIQRSLELFKLVKSSMVMNWLTDGHYALCKRSPWPSTPKNLSFVILRYSE